MANIVADVIIGMSPMFADKLVKGGTLICSGILNERAEEVRAALEKSGFTILSHEKSDDWSAFAAKKVICFRIHGMFTCQTAVFC